MAVSQQQMVQHLFWRAGFGLSPKAWQKNRNRPIASLVDKLVDDAQQAKPLAFEQTSYQGMDARELRSMSAQQKSEKKKEARKLVAKINLDWLERMGRNDTPLLEKMTLFWHDHFACQIKEPNKATGYINVLREHALGDFKSLVVGVAKTPAMIRFLNNQQNKKQKPNENFARELMELFTIGRGNYSEQDVKESARAFTGWTSSQNQFEFRERWHDDGVKTFMGNRGNWGGEDIIDFLLEKKETARFIVEKIYRYFVSDKLENTIANQLTDQFYNSNYDIGELMRTIFKSDWFYAAENIGTKIKSPIEYLAGMMQLLDTKFEDRKPLLQLQKALGQVLLNPPNVAGWPGGKAWIDNATLLLRLNLPNFLLNAGEMNVKVKDEFESKESFKRLKNVKVGVDLKMLESTLENSAINNDQLEELSRFVLQAPIGKNKAIINRFFAGIGGDNTYKNTVIGVLSLPEYQLC